MEAKDIKIESESDASKASSDAFWSMWVNLNKVRPRPDKKVKTRNKLGTMMSTIRGREATNERIEVPKHLFKCSTSPDIVGLFKSCKSKEECSPPPLVVDNNIVQRRSKSTEEKRVGDNVNTGYKEDFRTSIDDSPKLPKLNIKRKVID